MIFPYGQSVTVTRPAARDATGDPTGPPPSPHTLDNCAISWNETSTDHDRRTTTVTQAKLYCPADSDIRAGDSVRLPDGLDYLVEGQPERWKSPWNGWEPGAVVRLKGVR